jgi:hypothetical protein
MNQTPHPGIVLSHAHKFIFLHFPKTGGSSILSVLEKNNICKEYPLRITAGDCREYGLLPRREGGWARHLPAVEACRMVPADMWQRYFKFAFVRNPWDWMVSTYHYHLQSFVLREARPDIYLRAAQYKDFRAWVRATIRARECPADFLSDEIGVVQMDFIGRFEHFQQDFDRVCDHVGLPRMLLPMENRSEHDHYSCYYDDETREIVRRHFYRSVSMFGYRFESV